MPKCNVMSGPLRTVPDWPSLRRRFIEPARHTDVQHYLPAQCRLCGTKRSFKSWEGMAALDVVGVLKRLKMITRLRSSHRMRAVGTGLQTEGCRPVTDNTCVSTGRDVKSFVKAPGPEMFRADHQWLPHPPCQRCTGAFGDFETDRFLSLALLNRRAFLDLSGCHDIEHLHFH